MPYTGDYDGSCPVCDTYQVKEVHEDEEAGVKTVVYLCENDHEYEVEYEGWIEEIHDDGDDQERGP